MKGLNIVEKSTLKTNNDLDRLARDVLAYYDIKPESISVIQGGTIKTVWKVMTKDGALCLKRLKQTYDKALFSVNAQIYIKNNGGKVPAIIPARDNQPIVQHNDQLFVMYEWIDGTSLDFNNNNDLIPSIKGLAAFHTASKGYVPPAGARLSSKLLKWPEQYTSMKNRMLGWKDVSRKNSSRSDHAAYLKHVDSMIDVADLALYLIERSSYSALASPESPSVVLCHQDYGKGNALLADDGVYVLDLDGVTFDLPARDLRKIIGKKAENRNLWDEASINSVIQSYTAVNPQTPEEKEVVFIDMVFPHWYFGLIKNMFQSNKSVKPSEIERIVKLEQSKLTLLNTMIKRGE